MALLVAIVSAPAASAAGFHAQPNAAGTPSDGPTRLDGIDVSQWQGTINWPMVAGAGKAFAIIKATQGRTFNDPTYATNHAGAKAAGLWTGAYHFAEPDATAGDAIAEADHFVSIINLGAHDLIPALDLEQSGGLSVAALQAWVIAWMGEVTARIGIRPMIYTSPNFWTVYMGNTTALADAGYKTLWIAHWGVTTPTIPANNWGGHGWTFWQYTSSGSVPGISGRVDLDRYNGTDLAVQAYSIFKLVPTVTAGLVKQGQSTASTVRILRTNFPAGIALGVSGLPAGTTAAFTSNPSVDATASLTLTTPADPNATPVGTYPITITGVANGMTGTAAMNFVVVDGIAPAVTGPSTSLLSGTLGTTVPVRMRWTATDASGVSGQSLQRSVNATAWRGLGLPSVATRTIVELLPINAAVLQRVRASDPRANFSRWSYGPLIRNAVFQQGARAVTYTGIWRSLSTYTASGGNLRYSIGRGATASFRFFGSSVGWVSARGPGRGLAYVYVDGVYITTINLYSSVTHSRAIVFARNWGGNATHTLTVVNAGTRGHSRVDVDAFIRFSMG
ncbi:MAG TPA: glycoside hydrolase family 25 protein [Candidatus Bathyarchaeia archaeon]|nr:glycoside hydrolase family 25 protein [Candidatus Bathyarchaeia archaeon]